VVARHRGAHGLLAPARGRVTDAFLPKIEEWIEASKGRIRADKAQEKLLALGYTGSERSTRRAIARVKAAWRLGHTRLHRPWITEPGMRCGTTSATGHDRRGQDDPVRGVAGVLPVPDS
jgi:hypothetical protein